MIVSDQRKYLCKHSFTGIYLSVSQFPNLFCHVVCFVGSHMPAFILSFVGSHMPAFILSFVGSLTCQHLFCHVVCFVGSHMPAFILSCCVFCWFSHMPAFILWCLVCFLP